jgi:hypothetical protein
MLKHQLRQGTPVRWLGRYDGRVLEVYETEVEDERV